jgi:G3E family GTPase
LSVADPAPVAQTFFVDDEVNQNFELDGIVSMVDSMHILAHLDDEKPKGVENEAVEQIAFADRIVLNKTDLVSAEQLQLVKDRIKGINSFAPMIDCEHAKIDLNFVLGIKAFNLQRVLEQEPEFLADQDDHHHDSHGHHHHHKHRHDKSVTSVGIETDRCADHKKLVRWLRELLGSKGADIFRSKGIVRVQGSEVPFVFQGVHMMLDVRPMNTQAATNSNKTLTKSKLVFIGRNLDRAQLQQSFAACLV